MTDRFETQLREVAAGIAQEALPAPDFDALLSEPHTGPRRPRHLRSLIAAACLIAVLVVILIAIRASDTDTQPVSPPGSWPTFCGVANKIADLPRYSDDLPGEDLHQYGNPNFARLRHRLVAAAPEGRFRDAMRLAEPHLQLGPPPSPRVLAAMRTVNEALNQHCGLDTATLFGVALSPAPSR